MKTTLSIITATTAAAFTIATTGFAQETAPAGPTAEKVDPTHKVAPKQEQTKIVPQTASVAEADKALNEGHAAYAKKDYKKAHELYKKSLSFVPPGLAVKDRRDTYTKHLGEAAFALARQYRRVGKYDDARKLLEDLLKVDPTISNLQKQLEYLDDPIRTNPTLTFEHTKNVNEVRKRLYKGDGYFNLKMYDHAEAEFKKVLLIDPYNKAALRWIKKISSKKSE